MDRRPLTDAEGALVRSMFGDAVDTGRVTIRRARWWPFQPPNVLMAPDGHLWCHPAGPLWRDCYAAASLSMQALFVHEMTHVWQAQRGGRWYLPLMRHPFCRYAYTLQSGKPFARYGIEQQAEIVADAFLLARGVARPGKPGLEAYKAVLPFEAPLP
ncbi:vgr related protein [Sphingomonas histidinilytica]|nr:vgr related protein [Rhizorhabdus histidinilytica]MBO9378043.1 vgr related protein [Rhizorhabdus histidinilytica]